jgi:hypothetical protein
VQLELVIVAMVVRNPKLVPVLAQSGAVAEFIHPRLREVADAISSGSDPQDAVRAVEPDALRQRLLDAVSDMERAGDQSDAKRLQQLIKKHANTVALDRKKPAPPRGRP